MMFWLNSHLRAVVLTAVLIVLLVPQATTGTSLSVLTASCSTTTAALAEALVAATVEARAGLLGQTVEPVHWARGRVEVAARAARRVLAAVTLALVDAADAEGERPERSGVPSMRPEWRAALSCATDLHVLTRVAFSSRVVDTALSWDARSGSAPDGTMDDLLSSYGATEPPLSRPPHGGDDDTRPWSEHSDSSIFAEEGEVSDSAMIEEALLLVQPVL